MTSVTSSPSRAKSADRMLGAMTFEAEIPEFVLASPRALH
jgi:hypothetical protein